jgi:hypothetical protein
LSSGSITCPDIRRLQDCCDNSIAWYAYIPNSLSSGTIISSTGRCYSIGAIFTGVTPNVQFASLYSTGANDCVACNAANPCPTPTPTVTPTTTLTPTPTISPAVVSYLAQPVNVSCSFTAGPITFLSTSNPAVGEYFKNGATCYKVVSGTPFSPSFTYNGTYQNDCSFCFT